AHAFHLRDAAAYRRAEDHEVEGRRDHRRHQALHQRAPGARHLEQVDRADRVEVHAPFLSASRVTKMSSSELCVVCRSLKRIPAAAQSPSSAVIAARSPFSSYVYTRSVPLISSLYAESEAGRRSIGCSRCRVSCFFPSLRISSVLSSTRMISPLLITPMR